MIDRIGVRYIDRVVGDNLRDLSQLVRPEVAGVLGSSLAAELQLAVAENVFVLPGGAGQLKARWGLVPARSTIDPGAVDAIAEPSWILDLDASATETREFDVDAAVTQARRFAERIYSFFRWTVDDEFLRRYGGNP